MWCEIFLLVVRMRKLIRLAALTFSELLQYRLDMTLWILSEAIVPLIALAIWYRVASSNPSTFSPQDALTYYLLVMFTSISTSAWNGYFLATQILNGELAQYLTRPLSIFWRHIFSNIAEKFLKFLIPLPIFIAVVFIFPQTFSPALYSWKHFGLYIVSLLLAATLAFVLDMNLGSLAFWLEEVHQIRAFRYLLEEVASGVLVPFALMPAAIATALSFLPFRYIISVPVEIMMGRLEGLSALQFIGYQIGWVILFIALLSFLWKRGLRRYAIPGQ